MAKQLGLSETNARRYYYGVHHVNGIAVQWEKGYTQMRQGACVTLLQLAHQAPKIRSGYLKINKSTNPTKIMFEELWNEIQDMQGEIFDLNIPELEEERFDFDGYLAADYDF